MSDAQNDFTLAMAALGGDSPTAIAKALGAGTTRQVVEYWQNKGHVPTKSAALVERKCRELGCAVSVENLCPMGRWVRVADAEWPHPAGRPLLDVFEPERVAA